jgi:hypothetical protein
MLPIWLIVALLCAVIPTAASREESMSPVWTSFGFDACALPCWSGITTGETPFSDAMELIGQHVRMLNHRVLVSASQINFSASAPEQPVHGYLFYNGTRVGSIRLTLQLPLRELIVRAGEPACVFATSIPPGMSGSQTITPGLVVYWEIDSVLLGVLLSEADAVRLDSQTQSLWMSSTDYACTREDVTEWRGFGPAWIYRNR